MNSFRGRLITWIFVSLLAAMLVMRLGWGKGKHRRFQDQAREETANAYPGGRIALPSYRRSDLIPDGYVAG